ncbi:unnamed protein product [Protopolystoma xenopodis]|uniref:Uncharacterized protein n=1 Tax=Protopolystoma xenopodis TaxID=117903 RepID=A0A448XKB7_9PLAT|nr:unnamed protein product [Protopolystoma xenopodis]
MKLRRGERPPVAEASSSTELARPGQADNTTSNTSAGRRTWPSSRTACARRQPNPPDRCPRRPPARLGRDSKLQKPDAEALRLEQV